jgi:hypothetical protein
MRPCERLVEEKWSRAWEEEIGRVPENFIFAGE